MNIDVDEIYRNVKANQALLEACPRHDFSIPINRRTGEPMEKHDRIFCKWKCAKCGGIVEGDHKRWYERGLNHAAPAGAEG